MHSHNYSVNTHVSAQPWLKCIYNHEYQHKIWNVKWLKCRYTAWAAFLFSMETLHNNGVWSCNLHQIFKALIPISINELIIVCLWTSYRLRATKVISTSYSSPTRNENYILDPCLLPHTLDTQRVKPLEIMWSLHESFTLFQTKWYMYIHSKLSINKYKEWATSTTDSSFRFTEFNCSSHSSIIMTAFVSELHCLRGYSPISLQLWRCYS